MAVGSPDIHPGRKAGKPRLAAAQNAAAKLVLNLVETRAERL
ncbi:hypothetical protein [Mobiluncus mulieris]|nr:hypothetical protein [Mobiluncus mulieris]